MHLFPFTSAVPPLSGQEILPSVFGSGLLPLTSRHGIKTLSPFFSPVGGFFSFERESFNLFFAVTPFSTKLIRVLVLPDVPNDISSLLQLRRRAWSKHPFFFLSRSPQRLRKACYPLVFRVPNMVLLSSPMWWLFFSRDIFFSLLSIPSDGSQFPPQSFIFPPSLIELSTFSFN